MRTRLGVGCAQILGICNINGNNNQTKVRLIAVQFSQNYNCLWYITLLIWEIQIIVGDHKRWLPTMGGPHKKNQGKFFFGRTVGQGQSQGKFFLVGQTKDSHAAMRINPCKLVFVSRYETVINQVDTKSLKTSLHLLILKLCQITLWFNKPLSYSNSSFFEYEKTQG